MATLPNGYWSRTHPHPLAPNDDDVEIYRRLVRNSRSLLLLGNTPALMNLCTVAMDLDPFVNDQRVRQQDWTSNSDFFDAIIGDGVLNFTESLSVSLLDMAAKHCSIFVARAFTRRLPIMQIADYFPGTEDFSISPNTVIDRSDYSFFVWRFSKDQHAVDG